MDVVIQGLKQRIAAIGAKVRRYQEKVDKFRQSRMFQNNQRQFYRELNQKGERCGDDLPDAKKSKFWRDLWSELVDHNRDDNGLKTCRVKSLLQNRSRDHQSYCQKNRKGARKDLEEQMI